MKFIAYDDKDIRFGDNLPEPTGAAVYGRIERQHLYFHDGHGGPVYVRPRVLSAVIEMHRDMYGCSPSDFKSGENVVRSLKEWY